MWFPLLHFPLHRRVNSPLRVDREQQEAVPGDLRLPLCRAGVHPRAQAGEAAERGPGCGRDGERDSPRDRRAGLGPTCERLVRGQRPKLPRGDRRPVRGHLRHRGRWVLHGPDAGGQGRGHVQHEWRQEEVPGPVGVEPLGQLLQWPQCARPVTSAVVGLI